MKVLIAEDDRVTALRLESRLRRWGYDVVKACNGREAWEILQQDDCPRLVLLDWVMPEMDGLEVCQRVRKLVADPYRYIVMLTVNSQQDDIVEGLEAGADDYLCKPVDMQELKVRLRAGKRIIDLQAELVAARDKLQHQAAHDVLTGLWNRGSILDAVDRELARARRDRTALTIVMADVDHFKNINDTHGHPGGDAVLVELGRRLKAGMRRYDAIGRYGGEEFLFVLPGGGTHTDRQTERLRALIADHPILHDELEIRCTISIGAAVYQGWSDATPEQLIKHADDALYRAKAAGRNRVEIWQEPSKD